MGCFDIALTVCCVETDGSASLSVELHLSTPILIGGGAVARLLAAVAEDLTKDLHRRVKLCAKLNIVPAAASLTGFTRDISRITELGERARQGEAPKI